MVSGGRQVGNAGRGRSMMTLIERAAEITTLRGALRCTTEGDGRVVVVSGPTASGKTELVQAFARTADEQGAVVLTATAGRSHQNRPLGVVAELMRQAESYSAQVRQLTDSAVLTATLHMHGTGGAEHVRPSVLHGLWTELAMLAQARPVVIVVDDVQHADVASVTTLLFLARRANNGRVMLVFALAAEAGPTRPRLRSELLRLPHCQRIRLAPLSPAGLADLLGEVMPAARAEALAAEAYQVSGGSPLLGRGLLVDNRRQGEPAPGLDVGDGYVRAVVSCLHRTGAEVRRVAQGVALLGDGCSTALAAELLDMHTVLVAQATATLRDAGLLGPDGGFRHPLARVAVLETLTADDLVGLHAQAAITRYRQGAPAVTVARHLVAAGHPSAEWTIRSLCHGAEEALALGELDLALNCLHLAEQQCSDDRQRAGIRTMLAAVEWRIDPAAASRHLPALTCALEQGLVTGRHAAIVIEFLLWSGEFDQARAALSRLVERAGRADGAAMVTVAVLRPWLVHAFPEFGPLLEAGRRRGGPELPAPVHPGAQLPGATALTESSSPVEVLARTERVLAQCDPDDLNIGTITASLAELMYADELEKAGSWCDRLLRAVNDRCAPLWQALLTAMRAGITGRQGNLQGAEQQARSALALLPAASWGVAIGIPMATMIIAAVGLGKLDEAAAYLAVTMPPGVYKTAFGLHYLHARGRYHLAVHRFDEALADFQHSGELMRRWGRDLPAVLPWRSDAAVAQLALGRPEQARELLREQLGLLTASQHRARGLTLRVLASTVPPAERLPLLREALELFESSGDRLAFAQVFADISSTQELLGARQQAEVSARRAHLWARQCGAEAVVRGLLPVTVDVGVDEGTWPAEDGPAVTDLSDAERRVASLAASGHTNRQIADELFVTVSTVEQHLTRVYRKLNVRRRADLPWQLQPGGRQR